MKREDARTSSSWTSAFGDSRVPALASACPSDLSGLFENDLQAGNSQRDFEAQGEPRRILREPQLEMPQLLFAVGVDGRDLAVEPEAEAVLAGDRIALDRGPDAHLVERAAVEQLQRLGLARR